MESQLLLQQLAEMCEALFTAQGRKIEYLKNTMTCDEAVAYVNGVIPKLSICTELQ